MPKKWSMSHPQNEQHQGPPNPWRLGSSFSSPLPQKGNPQSVQVAWGSTGIGIQHFIAEGCHRYFNRGQTSMGCLEKLHGFLAVETQVENIKSPLPVYQLLHIPLGLFFGSLPCNFSVSSPAWILLSMGWTTNRCDMWLSRSLVVQMTGLKNGAQDGDGVGGAVGAAIWKRAEENHPFEKGRSPMPWNPFENHPLGRCFWQCKRVFSFPRIFFCVDRLLKSGGIWIPPGRGGQKKCWLPSWGLTKNPWKVHFESMIFLFPFGGICEFPGG